MTSMPASSPWAPAAGASDAPSMPVIAASMLLQLVHDCERALHVGGGLQRVGIGEAAAWRRWRRSPSGCTSWCTSRAGRSACRWTS